MDEFIGIVKLFAGSYAPQGWAFCDGSLLNISQNSALFAILGTTYGGNGTSNFALPDLRSRVAVGAGTGPGQPPIAAGQMAGAASVTPTGLPTHTHNTLINNTPGTTSDPSSGILAQPNFVDNTTGDTVMINAYGTLPTSQARNISDNTGGAATPISVMQPYLGLNYIICVQGIFPPRNS